MTSNRHTFRTPSTIPLSAAPASDATPISTREILFFVKRRWHIMALSLCATLAIALAYLVTAEQTYVATTQLLVFPQVGTTDAQRVFEEDAFLEAQIEIASSSDVLDATAGILDLASDASFAERDPSLMYRVKSWLKSSTPLDQPADGQTGLTNDATHVRFGYIVAQLQDLVSVRRIGRSTIVEISAAASSASMATRIADTVAAQYIEKNLRMKADAARQQSVWLEKIVSEQQHELTLAANALATFNGDPRDQFKLTELQSVTDARRTLFENTLNQFTQAKQRISYPVSDATIVSNATTPLSHARPRSTLILAFATIVGIGFGVVIALIRHNLDRRIVRSHKLAASAALPFVTPLGQRTGPAVPATLPGAHRKPGSFIPGIQELAATLAGLRRKRKVILGIVAVDSGSGSSSIAYELAWLSAASGARTLLVDAASDSRSLSRLLAQNPDIGLTDVLETPDLLKTALVSLAPALHLLPFGQEHEVTPAIRLSSRRTELDLELLRDSYDAVFVDMTAFNASPDATALTPELDGIIVVTSYGNTLIDEAVLVVDSIRNLGATVLGAIINSAPKRGQV